MTTENLSLNPPVIEIMEVVELYVGSDFVSSSVVNKSELYSQDKVKYTYSFDCTSTPAGLFEKAVVANLTIDQNTAVELVYVTVSLDGVKTIIVEYSAEVN